jgi:hypothetical protein
MQTNIIYVNFRFLLNIEPQALWTAVLLHRF